MKIKLFIASFILVTGCCFFINAQDNSTQKELMLEEGSSLFLQDVPFKQGIDDFSARLDKIRQEEGREPLGLILCGGSARAFCHTGVLRAMEENQVRPDFIIANSMGAIIGLLYGYGFSPSKIEEVISKISIPSYFDLVSPLHGGLISVRKYEAIINMLLGEESHDVKDCEIPVLILSEDLYSKRQVWFAAGDFATVMNSAFSMPVFMEPVKAILDDGTEVFLTDAGSLDIGGIKIAESFSDNLIISTAFYDTELNYNNPIVVINRTMSIGKERIVVNDIKHYKTVVIRNDVEHFSFMEFDKAEEIGNQGYKSANAVMDKIVQLPHGFSLDEQWRTKTNELADQLIFNVQHQIKAPIARPYFGVKMGSTYNLNIADDFYVLKHDGLLLSAFEDLPYATIRAGIAYPFGAKGLSGDAYLNFAKNSWNGRLIGSYQFDFTNLSANTLYGAAKVGYAPKLLPSFIKEFYGTTEYLAAAPINTKVSDVSFGAVNTNFTLGMNLDIGKKAYNYLTFKPYGFISGTDIASLSTGIGAELISNFNIIKNFGIGESVSTRYAFASFNRGLSPIAPLFYTDFFRTTMPEASSAVSATSASEIYFIKPDCTWTFAEFVLVRQLKLGGFYDIAYTNSLYQCAGGFVRTYVSLIGLTEFIIEGGCGWNFNTEKFFGYFCMKNRM